MDENHSREFVNCLVGLHTAHHRNTEPPLQVYWNLRSNLWWKDLAPCYFGRHLVKQSLWNYPNDVSLLDGDVEQTNSALLGRTRELDLRQLPPHIVNDARNLAPNNQNSGFYFNANGASVDYRNWTVVRCGEEVSAGDFVGDDLMNGELMNGELMNGELRKGSPESSETSSAYCSESNFICSTSSDGKSANGRMAGNEGSEFGRCEVACKKVSFMEPSDHPTSRLANGYSFGQQRIGDLPHSFLSPRYNLVRHNAPGKAKIGEGMTLLRSSRNSLSILIWFLIKTSLRLLKFFIGKVSI